MIVMVSNDCGNDIGAFAERYRYSRCRLGHLYSPGGARGPWEYLPFGVDNECFALKQKNIPFRPERWRKHLMWAASKKQRPLWGLAPDEPYDRDRTLAMWEEYSPEIRAAGIRPAFAVQDEMTFDDVPDSECMIFLGGSTGWKEAAIEPWCERFPGRVHVGRVTEADRLWKSYRAGAVSVDGNKWHMRTAKPGSRPQWEVLVEFLEAQGEERMAA